MTDLEKKVKKIIDYGMSLKGTKYNKWHGITTCDNPYPFYLDNIPEESYIRKHGINCTGLINLMRQKINLPVPGKGKYKGAPPAWYYYLKNKKGGLEKFDDSKDYPVGTLFLRRYKNDHDRGHVAVYSKKNKKCLYGEILHSYYFEKPSDSKLGTTTLGFCHFWEIAGNKGYFEYASLPKYWLSD